MSETPLKQEDINTMVLKAIQNELVVLKGELTAIKEAVGRTWHDEHGSLLGVGVSGSLARLEKRVNDRFDRDDKFLLSWKARITGAAAMIGLTYSILAWALGDKLKELVK